jgi:carboxypeptidase family protein
MLLQPAAFGQSQFATLSGTVNDANGGVVAGAKVVVRGTTSGELRQSETNGDGFFTFATLPAGSYEVTAQIKGFQTWRGKDIVLNSSDNRSMKIEMKVGAVTDSVVVEGSTTEIAVVDSGEKASLISEKDLEQLSLVGRNASEFVKLLPGALLSPTGGKNQSNYSGLVVGINGFVPNGTNAGGLSGVNINGQGVNITQDGQNTFDPGAFGNATPVNPNPEMISEVKVLTSNFTAENPQGPVVVNTVTKSGGSEFHGAAYLYARNSALNATDKFNKEALICNSGTCAYPPGYNPKPPSSYYYPGGNIGGPIIIPGTNFNKSHKKLFFFDGYENYHQTVDAGVERAFVPTSDMLNGDFSALAASGSKVGRFAMGTVPTQPNATTWAAAMAQRPGCTITAGVLNSACIDPNGQLLMKAFMPAPNIPLSQIGSANGFNYIANFTAPQNSWQNTLKVDWAISENTKVYVSWSRQRESATMPYGLWNGASDWAVPSPSPVVGNNSSDFLVASFVHIFSPTMTSETRFGYTSIKFPTTPSDPTKLLRSEAKFPLTGIFNNPEMPALLTWGQSLPNFGDVGHDYHPAMLANKGIPSAGENLTKVIGTHTAKFGFFYQHTYNTQDNWGQYMGVLTYSPWSTPTGNNYADTLMGIGQSYFEQALPPPTSIAQNTLSFYVQDDWKVSRRLTLQYGMRLEHYGKPYAPVANVGLAIFDPSKYVASSGPDANSGVSWHKMNPSVPLSGATSTFLFYSPRLGAAYDLFGTGRTVVRGGWGMYRAYDSVQSNTYTGPAGTAFGSVGVSCAQFDAACASWETIDSLARPSPVNYGTSGLGPGLKSITTYDPTNHEQPLVYSYSVSIDQRLPARFSMELSYVGNKGTDFQQAIQINAVPFGALTASGVTCNISQTGCQLQYRPFQNYSGITGSETAGRSRFDSLQASVKRSYGWLSLQANYTWSKTLAAFGPSFTGALPNFGTNWLYGVSNLDRPQAFSTYYVFSLPNSKSGNAFLRGAASGWQISGITQIQSGQQLLNSSSGQARNFNLQQGGTNQDNVHLLGSPDITIFPALLCNPAAGKRGTNQFVDPNCFGPQPAGKLGNAAMPYMGGPLYWNSDLTVMKNFKIKERQNVEFRVSAFNFMNVGLLSFAPSDSNLSLAINDMGQVITGAKNPADATHATPWACPLTGAACTGTSTFGVATHHVGNRVMSFGVKYSF